MPSPKFSLYSHVFPLFEQFGSELHLREMKE